MVRQADGRIVIMPGSGLRTSNIKKIIETTGAAEFHVNETSLIESPMDFRRKDVFMGGLQQIPEYQRKVVDANKIKQLVEIVKSL